MQVTNLERFSQTMLFESRPREGFAAEVTLDDGSVVSLSRYDDETAWLADSYIGANGFPYFVHGRGERYIAKRAAEGEMAALLDAALADRSVQ